MRRFALALLAVFTLAGCSDPDPALVRLDRVYRDGVDVRASLFAHGQPVNEKNCKHMYPASGAADRTAWTDLEDFKDQHRDYFMAGCLGKPQPGTPTPTP